jgi:hypothetical protein
LARQYVEDEGRSLSDISELTDFLDWARFRNPREVFLKSDGVAR